MLLYCTVLSATVRTVTLAKKFLDADLWHPNFFIHSSRLTCPTELAEPRHPFQVVSAHGPAVNKRHRTHIHTPWFDREFFGNLRILDQVDTDLESICSYLRHGGTEVFGLIASNSSNSLFDGKRAYVPALEDVFVWDTKRGERVS